MSLWLSRTCAATFANTRSCTMSSREQAQPYSEDNSERFARALPILLEVPSRWARALEPTVLPPSLELLPFDSDVEDQDDPRRGIMWFGGGDVFDGGAVYEKLITLQRNADKYRFLGALACVSTAARVAVAAVTKPSNAEMEVQVAQAATMVTLCAQAMDVEVMRELSIYKVRHDTPFVKLESHKLAPSLSLLGCGHRPYICGKSCAAPAGSRQC
jgi:hypothetical protein